MVAIGLAAGVLCLLIVLLPLSGATLAAIEIGRIGLGGAALFSADRVAEFYTLLLAVVAFPFGALAAWRFARTRRPQHVFIGSRFNKFGLSVAVISVVVLAAVHYLVVGLPAFAGDINEYRFSSGSSGYFGIPSRFATYGPNLLFILLLLCFDKHCRGQAGYSSKVIILLAIALVVLPLASLRGHKSALLSIAFTGIMTYRFLSVEFRRQLLWKALIPAGVLGFGAALYQGAAKIGADGILVALKSYFIERALVSGPDALFVAIDDVARHGSTGSVFFNELIYPVQQLLGGGQELYIKDISRSLYGIASGEFTVPVTPTIIAPIVHDFGLFVAPVAMLTVGYLYGMLMRLSRRPWSTSSFFLLASIEWLLYQGIARGAVFYIFLNGIVVLLPLWLLFRFSWRASKGHSTMSFAQQNMRHKKLEGTIAE